MALITPARLSALALVVSLSIVPLAATPAAATDDGSRTPVAVEPAPLTAAAAERADESATARIVREDAPTLSPATTASLTGVLQVYGADGSGPFAAQTDSSWVRLWRLDPEDGLWHWQRDITDFGSGGEFEASGLEPGDYRVEFVSYDQSVPAREYWDNQPIWFNSTVLTLAALTGVGLGTITLQPALPDFFRIAGADRFGTAVAISQGVIGPEQSAPVVYLVSGLGYADALSAGPAAARGGGVMLLTLPTRLPDNVAVELARLDPERIVVVGGPSLVSLAVEQQLQAYVDDPGDITRIYGSDRYATSRMLVADAFPDGVPALFIGTGRNFPDALAAGPAAARLGGAVLLVDGALSSTDVATRTLITELGLPDLHLAGGTGVISTGVQNSLTAHVDGSATVTRYSGANRYDTALAMNAQVFGPQGADFAFLATGAGFADALAGGPLAAAYDAPLYLSAARCLRSQEYVDIVMLLTKEVYALGGTGVLSDRVLTGDLC